MIILGLLLIFLAAPLLLMYALAEPEKRNKGQFRLGLILAGVGLLIAVLPG